MDTKRDPVYDNKNLWVDTKPKDVIDFGGQESTILKLELKLLNDKYHCISQQSEMKDQTIAELQSEIAKLKSELASLKSELHEEQQSAAMRNLRPLTEQPTQYKYKPTAGDG